MTITTVAQTIQLILAPVVIVTSCALVVSGLLQRYAAINDRMRTMVQERLNLVRALRQAKAQGDPPDALNVERMSEIDKQLPNLVHRHRLIHNSVLTIYYALFVEVGCMFVIAVATVANSSQVATAALVVFLIGTLVLLFGIGIAAQEIRTSQIDVQYEVQRVLRLGTDEQETT